MKTMKELKVDAKIQWEVTKIKARQKFYATKQWCEQNPGLALAIASGIGIGLRGLGRTTKSIDRKLDMRRQEQMMDNRIYVPQLHKHVELKRPMNKWETVEYDRRKAEGESIVSILYDMGLLK